MAEKITYYAIVPLSRTPDNPAGLARRHEDETGLHDEAIGRDLTWHRTGIIVEWRRGEADPDLVEISEEQANALIDRFRERWANL